MKSSVARVVAQKIESDEARFEAIDTVIELLDRRADLMEEIAEASSKKFMERIHKLENQVEELVASR